MLFIQYPKCSICQKAKKWLDAHNIVYTERHIANDNPSYDELKEWYEKSGLLYMLIRSPRQRDESCCRESKLRSVSWNPQHLTDIQDIAA